MATLVLQGKHLTVRDLGALAEDDSTRVELSSGARENLRGSRAIVDAIGGRDEPFYGINTGFGPLCRVRVQPDQLEKLQQNLLLSHAVGVGPPVPEPIVRLMLAIKANSLAMGYSGVSPRAVELLVEFLNRGITPVVPQQGSVGASGDLAPLAHLCLPLLGLGRVTHRRKEKDAAQALRDEGLEPFALRSKDGLALLNGTQFMSAYGVLAAHRGMRLARCADINTGVSLEALKGSLRPYLDKVHAVRPHRGQRVVASNVRRIMADSEILESHKNCDKVQDPYSLRCVPQVHGASRDALEYAIGVLETEINSATDNPLVFDDGDVVSQGNFHGQPLALALDFAAIAVAELGSISERRTYLLLEGQDGLPKLLMRDTGLNSGFMIPQYTSAALVSENKVLCHPASVDSIPTSLGQEDHVSMGSISATKLLRVLENTEYVIGIELLCASQGVDYRLPLRPGAGVAAALRRTRESIPHAEEDRFFAPFIEEATQLIRRGELLRAVEEVTGELD